MGEERDIAVADGLSDESQLTAQAARRSQTSARGTLEDRLEIPRAGLVMDSAIESALAQLRAPDDLEPTYSLPPIDLLNPKIPKAPALPHDLSRMPNAQLPVWSDPPSWVMTDPLWDETTDAPPPLSSERSTDPWPSAPAAQTTPAPRISSSATAVPAKPMGSALRKSDLLAIAALLASVVALALQWLRG